MRRLDLQVPCAALSPYPVDAAVEAGRGRAGSALAGFVIDAPGAGPHDQAGLLEPLRRTAQVGAVDGEDQEPVTLRLVLLLRVPALVPDISSRASHHTVPRLADG